MYKWVKKYRIEEDIFEEERDNILMAIEMIKDEADTQFAKMTASDYKVARKEQKKSFFMQKSWKTIKSVLSLHRFLNIATFKSRCGSSVGRAMD